MPAKKLVGQAGPALMNDLYWAAMKRESQRNIEERNGSMQTNHTRMPWISAVTLFLATLVATESHAQDGQPVDVLKAQRLKRAAGSNWVLADEAMILKNAREASSLSMQLRTAQEQQQALEGGNQNPQVLIENYRQQLDWLDQRIGAYDQELANLGPAGGNQAANVYHNLLVTERNAIVVEQRRLSSVINNLAGQRGQFQELKQQFNGEVARLRESYMQAISGLRQSVDEITAKYTELNGKEEVVKALKDLSASSKTKQKLGPSKELAAVIKWLAKSEGSVQSEAIELHREGGVDHVDVMLNGKGPFKMVFDTGAGPTTLPADLASRLGLKATGRTISCVVADGTTVKAKEMIIPRVSVGKLSVKDVTCVIMPKDKGDVDPLLGQSFLQRFDFKYTQGSGRLVLTKVEPDEPVATPKKGNPPRKKLQGR
jgi:clan AA aspartic protease (TIGR02281 family)